MKNVMKIIAEAVLAAAIILTVQACSQNASTVSPSDAEDAMKHLMYDKDPRSKLCYAIVASRGQMEVSQNGFTITYVPCTLEVEQLIAEHHQ